MQGKPTIDLIVSPLVNNTIVPTNIVVDGQCMHYVHFCLVQNCALGFPSLISNRSQVIHHFRMKFYVLSVLRFPDWLAAEASPVAAREG